MNSRPSSKKIGLFFLFATLVIVGFVWYGRANALPQEFHVAVPFTTQAPDGNWEGNENCEEASAVMVAEFLGGNTAGELEPVQVQQKMNQLISWEQSVFGYNANTGADQTARMVKENYPLAVTPMLNYSAVDLKKALAKNQPVLLMVDASKLDPDTYRVSGRLYHVVVVRGYDEDEFFVNDPGTEKGNNREHSFETIYNAAADWDHQRQALDPNRKVALVISKR